MKSIHIYTSIFLIALALVFTPVVLAQDSENSESVESSESTVVETDQIQERLERRESRAKQKCEIVKARLQAVGERTDKVRERRHQRYDNINERLERLLERLVLAGVDATVLEEQLDHLNNLIIEFRATFGEFNAALLGGAAVSCEDKDSRKQLIDEAKELRNELKDQAKEIRNYLDDEIKVTLKEIKTELQGDNESEAIEEPSENEEAN